MKPYIITSDKAKREIIKLAENVEEVRDYVIAHLDLSQEPWTITESKTQL